MSAPTPVVCIGLPTWEGEYAKSTVQVMSRLARDRQVLYVDYQYTVKDVLMAVLRRSTAPVQRIIGLRPRLRALTTEVGTTVHVLTPPPVLPINILPSGHLYEMVRRFNQWMVLRSVRRTMEELGIRKPIVVNAFNPFIGAGSVGMLGERSHVYYCYDEIAAAPWAQRHGGRLEKTYLAEVDSVITTSEPLEREKGKGVLRIVTVRNGVDAELFTTASGEKRTEQNVIGYVGSVDDRFDSGLVVQVARAFPHAQVRIIGRIVRDDIRRRLELEPNVVCTGPKPMQEVAREVRGFSVGLIPFVRSEFTRHVYPLKVNEYLSAGVPVVMTDFADLPEFRTVVHTAPDQDSFIAAVGEALDDWSPGEVDRRRMFGSGNDWNNRVAQFAQFIDGTVPSGHGRAA